MSKRCIQFTAIGAEQGTVMFTNIAAFRNKIPRLIAGKIVPLGFNGQQQIRSKPFQPLHIFRRIAPIDGLTSIPCRTLCPRGLPNRTHSQDDSGEPNAGIRPVEPIARDGAIESSGLSSPGMIAHGPNLSYSPNFAQIASTFSFVIRSISIIAGHGRSNPSAFHLRVASIPILLP